MTGRMEWLKAVRFPPFPYSIIPSFILPSPQTTGETQMTDNTETRNTNSACGCGSGSCRSGPGRWVWIVLIVAVAGVLIARKAGRKPAAARAPETEVSETPAAVNSGGEPAEAPSHPAQSQALPRLLDLGAHSCIPCKMMTPILEELKRDHSGVFKTEFIDVWENQEAARKYGIRAIPTQIFFDAEGKELFRHEGFFSKEDILATWERFGVKVVK